MTIAEQMVNLRYMEARKMGQIRELLFLKKIFVGWRDDSLHDTETLSAVIRIVSFQIDRKYKDLKIIRDDLMVLSLADLKK